MWVFIKTWIIFLPIIISYVEVIIPKIAKINASTLIPTIKAGPAQDQCCNLASAPISTTDAPNPMIKFFNVFSSFSFEK
jgi:hypothetical protein